MGKRTKKRRQNNKNNQHQKTKPTTDNKDTPVLLQRIRHADPRTRHAALAAVANTLLDTSRKTPPKTSTILLQAIRERVLDADLDVSQVAAGCLANYVTILANLPEELSTTQSMTAGWTLVLVGRLNQCLEPLMIQTTQPANSNKKKAPTNNAKLQKQWLALAVQCVRTLCVLMETNPEAVGRLTSGMDATPRRDFHQTLLEWMQHCQHYYDSAAKDDLKHYYQQILTLSARTLHSAWDDNADLLLPWKEECPDAFRHAIALLESILKANNNLPVVAQLHCMGAFWTARPLMTNAPQQQALTEQTVLPGLTSILSQFSWTKAKSLLEPYQQATVAWQQEQADDALEKDVIRQVDERKEPARNIAKRQKALKDQKKTTMEEEVTTEETKAGGDDAMQDDTAEQQHQQQVETQQALEQAREAWNDFLLPLQLSLELLANLTSGSGGNPEDEDDAMMMDEDWGPDQEAQWMQEQQEQQQTQQGQSAEEQALQKLLVESPLPAQLKLLSQQVYQVPQDVVFPEQSREDLEDLQSKTMACLGNCWESIPIWPADKVSWAELQQAATTATGLGQEGLVSAMVVALRTFSAARKEWQPEHVTFWLNQLSSSSSQLVVRRDIITMLGILCSQEPHPVEVNQKICAALLAASESADSVMISCEVLNVLMDMYGNDDEDDGCCHGSVFESLQVLGHFQRSIPTLKSKLKQEEQKGLVDKVDVEQWKETLLNASRFVQYKKGQL